MGESWINGVRELSLKLRNARGNGAELFEVRGGIAGVEIPIRDNGEPLAQRGRERLVGSD